MLAEAGEAKGRNIRRRGGPEQTRLQRPTFPPPTAAEGRPPSPDSPMVQEDLQDYQPGSQNYQSGDSESDDLDGLDISSDESEGNVELFSEQEDEVIPSSQPTNNSNNNNANIVTVSHNVNNQQELSDIAENIINEDYAIANLNSIKTDDVAQKLAEKLTSWLRVCPAKPETKELFKNCLIPGNVEGLNPTRINELLYARLPYKAKEIDKKLKATNTFLTRGLGPLMALLDTFIKIEANCRKHKFEIPNFECEGKTVNLREMREQLVNGIKLLSAANAINLQKRRVAIKPYLDQKYQSLTKPSNPITLSLLGDNIEQKMSEMYKMSMATRRRSRFLARPERFVQKKQFYRNNRANYGNYSTRPWNRPQNSQSQGNFHPQSQGNFQPNFRKRIHKGNGWQNTSGQGQNNRKWKFNKNTYTKRQK